MASENHVQLGRGHSVLSPKSSVLWGLLAWETLRVGGRQLSPVEAWSIVLHQEYGLVRRDARSGQGFVLCRRAKEGELSGTCTTHGQSSAFLLVSRPTSPSAGLAPPGDPVTASAVSLQVTPRPAHLQCGGVHRSRRPG